MKKVLTIKNDDGSILAIISQLENQSARIEQVKDTVQVSTQEWIDYGLDEWTSTDVWDLPDPRHTDSNDPMFLDRLFRYLDRFYKFDCQLHEEA